MAKVAISKASPRFFFQIEKMSLLNCLLCHEHWINYYEYAVRNSPISSSSEDDLFKFIRDKEYLPIATKILGGGTLSHPCKRLINKVGTNKKRIVYTFNREENYILKFITFILIRQYDYCFADNLYSFRVDCGAKRAINRIVRTHNIDDYYSYKVDISNYFNSINIDKLLIMLRGIFADDEHLYNFFETLLRNPYIEYNGKIIEEDAKGVMAGNPTAAFLANIYLSGLDKAFQDAGILYCRYSDDIIIFAKSMAEIAQHKEFIIHHLRSFDLTINHSKEFLTLPEQQWEYLGFAYCNGDVDISPISLRKLKARMRRKSGALLRWQRTKNKPAEAAARAFVKRLNRKLYDTSDTHETNWSRWYFPLITTDKSLKEIDKYTQECIRHIISGRHSKSNYRYTYHQIKQLGYKSLVRNWWAYHTESNN
ncbi:MAG: RNA-directed DNA polymerase [Rikenellaceae bacterium]|nr:RNA-directed DNA polymerase [Rikenellaceae bacterium]